MLVFLNNPFPDSENIERCTIADYWFKMDRFKPQIILHSRQPYKVNFTENLTLRVERLEEKIVCQYKNNPGTNFSNYSHKKFEKFEEIGKSDCSKSWWVIDVY